MSPWADVLGRIQACDADGTARLVTRPDAAGRRQVAPRRDSASQRGEQGSVLLRVARQLGEGMAVAA